MFLFQLQELGTHFVHGQVRRIRGRRVGLPGRQFPIALLLFVPMVVNHIIQVNLQIQIYREINLIGLLHVRTLRRFRQTLA